MSNTIDDRWHSLEDSMPKEGQFVIVWINRAWCGEKESSAGRCHYLDGKFDLVGDPGGEVTHWMPWPQKQPGAAR